MVLRTCNAGPECSHPRKALLQLVPPKEHDVPPVAKKEGAAKNGQRQPCLVAPLLVDCPGCNLCSQIVADGQCGPPVAGRQGQIRTDCKTFRGIQTAGNTQFFGVHLRAQWVGSAWQASECVMPRTSASAAPYTSCDRRWVQAAGHQRRSRQTLGVSHLPCGSETAAKRQPRCRNVLYQRQQQLTRSAVPGGQGHPCLVRYRLLLFEMISNQRYPVSGFRKQVR